MFTVFIDCKDRENLLKNGLPEDKKQLFFRCRQQLCCFGAGTAKHSVSATHR
jgi:hypothetical protein